MVKISNEMFGGSLTLKNMGGGLNVPVNYRNAFFNFFSMVQYFSLTFQANVHHTFWHPFGVTKPLGDRAIGRQSPKTRFWPKYKMAARDLVWPRNFLVKKQKFLKFVNQWRSVKSGPCVTKNE